MSPHRSGTSQTAGTQLFTGRVIAHLGKGLAVEGCSGELILCHTRRRLGSVCVGDRVLWERLGEQGRVVEILPRQSLLTRPTRQGKTRPVAANIDQLFIVLAPEPPFDLLLLDQYLAVCENHSLAAALLFNKIDLLEETESVKEALSTYTALGYPLHFISSKTGAGLRALKGLLRGHTSLLAGQSGVGKSSLTNRLLPDKELRITPLSESSRSGKHTTTTATLYHLPGGGDLIDTPGVAIFGLADMTERQLAYGFREFRGLMEQCLFNDCRHVNDKGCAIRAAVEDGRIDAERYARFLKLRDVILG